MEDHQSPSCQPSSLPGCPSPAAGAGHPLRPTCPRTRQRRAWTLLLLLHPHCPAAWAWPTWRHRCPAPRPLVTQALRTISTVGPGLPGRGGPGGHGPAVAVGDHGTATSGEAGTCPDPQTADLEGPPGPPGLHPPRIHPRQLAGASAEPGCRLPASPTPAVPSCPSAAKLAQTQPRRRPPPG